MTIKENKKKQEFALLELFRKHYLEFPKGIISPGESPDFILSTDPKTKIGIELTRLHRKASGTDLFSFENIAYSLLQKEEKLRLYRKKKLNAYWLILYVPGLAEPPRYNLQNKLLIWKFHAGFNKVFLLDPRNTEIFELRLT